MEPDAFHRDCTRRFSENTEPVLHIQLSRPPDTERGIKRPHGLSDGRAVSVGHINLDGHVAAFSMRSASLR
jgi:hypothetical protein